MSELEDLIGIYGAIDREVVENRTLATVVAPYLGAYNGGGAIGWFDEFESWITEPGGVSSIPGLESSIDHLSDVPTSGRMAARRLLAIAVAARVFPELTEPDAPVNLRGALRVDGLAGFENSSGADGLLDLLVDHSIFSSLDDWPELLQAATATGLLPESMLLQAYAKPCAGKLVEVSTPGDSAPAAELSTSFWTDKITVAGASRFLEPSNWPGCSAFWCEMRLKTTTSQGSRIYHEVVSLDCANKKKSWTVETYLEFAFTKMSNGARVSYMKTDRYKPPKDIILVDEGSLVVREEKGGIRVSTVKRIKFDHPFSGPSLAMVMCALGYASAAEDLVFNCAANAGGDSGAGTEFPP